MAVEAIDAVLDVLDTEDYAAFTTHRDSEPEEAPAAGEEAKPPSESDDAEEAEAGQTAADSETEEEEQQEEDEGDEKAQDKPGKGKRGIDRRFGKLTGKIAALESRLAELGEKPTEDDEEAAEEAASSTEKTSTAKAPEGDKAEKLVRPMLRDYEDKDDESAWDQYERALAEYNDAHYGAEMERRLAEQKQQLELQHAKATADADWSKAASRFPDYNEVVVNGKTQISAAMESTMRMDPESGTALAYYLGQHPDESLRIAKLTLATNEREWQSALIRAGMELGMIRAKLPAPGAKAKAEDKPAPKSTGASASPTAAQPPTTKKITSASKPPTTIRGGVATPKTDVLDEDDAADYEKWNKAREAQLRRK